MTPQEKAYELFKNLRESLMWSEDSNEDAKQCALVAVDEVIKSFDDIMEELNLDGSGYQYDTYKYWQEVKQEIEKL